MSIYQIGLLLTGQSMNSRRLEALFVAPRLR
jgi:hypothetical protein